MQSYEQGATALALAAALSAVVAYLVYAAVYNVCFHPLAKFPGPPVAAATTYWKAYVECIAQRSFCHVLVELHAQYGEMRAMDAERALTCIVPPRRRRPCRTQ